ncbi:hypothetical protein Dxin01_00185 [Deinococcus xinjiangensis]|uniref:Uncharacterized protein n=1 Tax=Deinococcus xinjiangensis TaxID=457454 RepID=A0ABP9V5A4_9DEIO
MAEKEAVLKVKVTKLTYGPDGRQYLPGDTIELRGAHAEVAAKHYNKKVETVDEIDPATKRAQANVAGNQAANNQAGNAGKD